jgi:DNA invertase Pin-like site-specific DNA recombinase
VSNVYGYARDSTASQERPSVQTQKAAIEEYRLRKLPNETWIDCWVDAHKAAGIPFLDRYVGGRLDQLLARGDHVIITHLDLGFRSVPDFLRTADYWKSRGVVFHLLEFKLDSSTPEAAAILSDFAIILQVNRRLINTRIRESQINRIRTIKAAGGHATGPAPLGFKVVGRKGKRKLVPDPNERAACIQIRNLNQGIGTPNGRRLAPIEIYFHLWKNNVKTKRGRSWSLERIKAAIILAKEWEAKEKSA